jgi:hypothetical protein
MATSENARRVPAIEKEEGLLYWPLANPCVVSREFFSNRTSWIWIIIDVRIFLLRSEPTNRLDGNLRPARNGSVRLGL